MRTEWSPQLAESLANAAGIRPLGERRWKVLACIREDVARRGRMPGLRRIESLTGVRVAELNRLFPGDAAGLIANLAGVDPPAPRG